MRRILIVLVAFLTVSTSALAATVDDAAACAGLIGSNGAVNLGSTTTLAAYHDGVEHYVTAFKFQGGGGQFGTLIPLPGVPTKVERGGGWTLQRLLLETAPQTVAALSAGRAAEFANADKVEVLQEVRIDALDITVLKGGGPAVAAWAQEHGFRLSPDAPEVLAFYAQRSPIFLAAVFDGAAAKERGQELGDGTPVHLTIPVDNPWVPLRILALGKKTDDRVEASVFLLTDSKPKLLPGAREGFAVTHSAEATDLLLDDLRSDFGMEWVPDSAWLTRLNIDTDAGSLSVDLAVDASGKGSPSPVAAGLEAPKGTPLPGVTGADESLWPNPLAGITAAMLAVVLAAVYTARRKLRASGR
jgi:Uncharacterized protein conserved in bacteria (DUF2330)